MVHGKIKIALLVVLISVSSSEHECSQDACSTFNPSGMPKSRFRQYHLDDSTGCWWLRDSSCSQEVQYCSEPCVGFVGMNFTVVCDFSDGVHLCKNGTPVYSSTENYVSAINYGSLSRQDAGYYECLNSSSGVVINAQNVTVNVNPRILWLEDNCFQGLSTGCQDNNCCQVSHDVNPLVNGNEPIVFSFGVLGENVTFTVDSVTWVQDSDTRSEVDLGLETVQHKTIPAVWSFVIQYHPMMVTRNKSSIIFRVKASNPTSSYSLCFSTNFFGLAQVFVSDDDLLRNTEVQEGQNATFQCKFTVGENADTFSFGFDIQHSVVIENKTVSSSSMVAYKLSYHDHYFTPYNCSSDCLFVVGMEEITELYSSTFTFSIIVLNVPKEINNSIVSCSLFHTYKDPELPILQWKKEATLSVKESTSNVRYVAVGLVFLVLLVVLVVTTAFIIRRRKNQTQRELNPDQIHLMYNSTDSSFQCEHEPASPVTQDQRVVSIEISDNSRDTRNGGLIVGDHFEDSNSEDYADTDTRFNSLVQLSSSESFYESLSESNKFVVYISYTDRKGLWVRTKLKPLIRSWHSSIEVNLHENSMIPGFAVSSERHRLILEADKIIIVVSRDYSNSPWCLYELEHAIHQKPSLCNGRVIPILTDGCRSLPSIISGVVHLSDQETDFSMRLRQAVFNKPRKTHCSDVI